MKLCFVVEKAKSKRLQLACRQGLMAADIYTTSHDVYRDILAKTYRAVVIDEQVWREKLVDSINYIRSYKKHLPIIILSEKRTARHRARLLNFCDDVLCKPFSTEELVARLRAILRRGQIVYEPVLEVADLRFHTQSGQVTRAGKTIFLRHREMMLLFYMMTNQNRIISQKEILEHVWADSLSVKTNSIEVHIGCLRRRLQTYPDARNLIETIPRRGYRMRA